MIKKHIRIIIFVATYVLLAIIFVYMCHVNEEFNERTWELNFTPSISETPVISDEGIEARISIRGYDDNEYAAWVYDYQGDEAPADPDMIKSVGGIYELTITNRSRSTLKEWEADIYFPEKTYFNSGWNGDFEFHQNVGSAEKIQTFTGGKVDVNDLSLDYLYDGVCIFVTANAGDYFTYTPSAFSQEVPLKGSLFSADNAETTIGFITYSAGEETQNAMKFEKGVIRYKMQRSLIEEPLFIPFAIGLLIWIIALFSMIIASFRVRRLKDQNELLERENEKVRAENREFIKRLKEAIAAVERADKAKTDFLFNMSHDIRTPLNAIVGFTNLLEKNIDDREKTEDYIAKIKSSSDFLLSLINNVLEMARVESGNVSVEETLHKKGDILYALYDVFEERMSAKNIQFTKELDIQTEYFYVDKLKVNEIFLNLLSNAHKYTPEGGSISFISRELPCDKEGFVKIQTVISDTGIGMSEEFLPHLFDKFSRDEEYMGGTVEGTGLGMPIVKHLVEMMGGEIHVESTLGKGTTCTVTFTHRIGSASDIVSEDTPTDAPQLTVKSILLAEDNDLNAEIAIEILAEAGITADRAKDGAECVKMLEEAEAGHYDLILMDVRMPVMNGYEATRTIRSLKDPAKSRIPIIAMTANAFEEDKRDAFEAGMNGHLGKPIDVAKLMTELAKY